MSTHIPFPSINQFRHVCGTIGRKAKFIGLDEAGEPMFNPTLPMPKLTFEGTVKLHGTNAAIVFGPEGTHLQSRERVLTVEEDNAGFMNHMIQHEEALVLLRGAIAGFDPAKINPADTIVVYGEWCGGNIQKGVAITGLPKMFVIFAIKVNDKWIDFKEITLANQDASIYSIQDFPIWTVEIDFDHLEVTQNKLAELTTMVEQCCPVGKAFGVEGVGEGIVWRCTTDPTSDYWFKVKGGKHSASKVKTLASVDIGAVENMRTFVTNTVTEARLEQGLQNLINEQRKPFDMTSIGDFIRWIHGDVVKEESDVLQASGLDIKKLGGPIAQAAKKWYVARMNTSAFAA